MLDSLTLSRFRSIKEAEVDFGDINILIGRNNSGKSSVLYALDLLINNFGESFSFDNTESDIGTLPTNVYKHQNSGEVELDLRVDFEQEKLNEISSLVTQLSSESEVPDLSFFGVIATIPVLSNIEGGNVTEVEAGLELYADEGSIVVSEPGGGEDISWQASLSNADGFPPIPISGDAEGVEVFEQIEEMFRDLKTNRFFYIHPGRLQKERVKEIAAQPRNRDVGESGQYVTDAMAYNRDNVDLSDNFDKTLAWIDEFGFEEAIAKIEQGPQYSLQLEDKDTGVQSNVLDIGSGTNQLISLITQSYFAPPRSVLLIEEPEIHLHPQYQAHLADFFIDAQAFGNHQFFLETHSQHLLTRLQLRIAEGEIDPAQIGLFFFDKDDEGTHIQQISINQNGEVEGGIPEFFEQDFDDVMERMRAIRNQESK